jgi:hypothetical protein
VPASYIRCAAPAFPVVAASTDYARSRPDWHYLEIATGHDAMVTAPAELAEVLLGMG